MTALYPPVEHIHVRLYEKLLSLCPYYPQQLAGQHRWHLTPHCTAPACCNCPRATTVVRWIRPQLWPFGEGAA